MATAMQKTTSELMTADELLRMPDDDCRYELIKGELKKMAPAGFNHGTVALNITTPFDSYIRKHKLGKACTAETGFKISFNPDTVRAPDLSFVCNQRLEELGEIKGFFPGAPDFALEVISSNDRFSEVQAKAVEWLEAGTKMVVVVDPPKRTVTVYRSLEDVVILTEKDTLDGGDVVPGWSMDVKDMFV